MDVNFPKLEEEILEQWKASKAFEKSVQKRKKGRAFVFYEGPPTANAGPGIHHVLGRVFKDIILRYKTMRGFFVERHAGWDTHGLPVELQIEKKLGLKSKKEIEQYGIAKFNAECKQSVWEFKKDWENLTERIGFWIDMKQPYITYETSYIETLWFIIKKFWQKKLLYKGHKVVPWCVRCGTALSSHELALGYKEVTDNSVYIKFKLKPGQKTGDFSVGDNTYILSWTTTPWTLPGNVGLAVGENIEYALVQKGEEQYILAKDLIQKVLGEANITRSFIGKELLGLGYEPLFNIPALKNENSYKIYPADFVTTTDGTGVVHTAVMYGEDDYNLGKKVGLPQHHTVDEQGNFTSEVPGLEGLPVIHGTEKSKETEQKILDILKLSGALFATVPYTHEYPFCWRCQTPLLYYARDSWFVGVSGIRAQLLKANETINWVPEHLKKGRMGEWLKEAKDWAFSRERYWGTPLPAWQCEKCRAVEFVGSVKDVLGKRSATNTYFMLRHGYTDRNKTDIMACWPEVKLFPLDKRGVQEALKAAKKLKDKKIELIFSSDLLRTKQTAEIVGNELGIKPAFDERLREWDVGTLNGKHVTELGKVWGKPGETPAQHYARRFVDPMPGGENYVDVQKRMYGLVKEMNEKYSGKNILIVSHELPLTLLETTSKGFSRLEITNFRQKQKKSMKTGEVRPLPFSLLPYNDDMEIDLHKPYVDEITFQCAQCGKAAKGEPRPAGRGNMKRTKEVVDVWFDSGAMPFAQCHWPFELKTKNYKLKTPVEFPADYIVEGIDQTRGWFYTLLAVSTLLGFKAPYKNVISFSHVLDEKGEKMSKSKGNTVKPMEVIEKYGIDAIRWYFYTINNPGDPKLFSEKDIQETIRKFLLTFWNSFVFYKTYVPQVLARGGSAMGGKSKNVLDQWILSRLNGTAKEATAKLDSYDVTGAARAIESFAVNDLSLWYIRRSRSRFSHSAGQDFKNASATLGYVLLETAKLCAPFIPFLSEYMYQGITGKKESIHWENYPAYSASRANKKLEEQMVFVREMVAKALAERAKLQIKVRQPLAALKIQDTKYPTKRDKIQKELLELICDEVNVKAVSFDKNIKQEVELDTHITPELKEEGMVRELLRSIQGMRKEAGYTPSDKIMLMYAGDSELFDLIVENEKLIKENVGVKTFLQKEPAKGEVDFAKECSIDSKKLILGIKKV